MQASDDLDNQPRSPRTRLVQFALSEPTDGHQRPQRYACPDPKSLQSDNHSSPTRRTSPRHHHPASLLKWCLACRRHPHVFPRTPRPSVSRHRRSPSSGTPLSIAHSSSSPQLIAPATAAFANLARTDLASPVAVKSASHTRGAPVVVARAGGLPPTAGTVYSVMLPTTAASLGLRIAGGVDTLLGALFVAFVEPDSPAAACGCITVGDRFLAVDGSQVTSLTRDGLSAVIQRRRSSGLHHLEFQMLHIGPTAWRRLQHEAGIGPLSFDASATKGADTGEAMLASPVAMAGRSWSEPALTAFQQRGSLATAEEALARAYEDRVASEAQVQLAMALEEEARQRRAEMQRLALSPTVASPRGALGRSPQWPFPNGRGPGALTAKEVAAMAEMRSAAAGAGTTQPYHGSAGPRHAYGVV